MPKNPPLLDRFSAYGRPGSEVVGYRPATWAEYETSILEDLRLLLTTSADLEMSMDDTLARSDAGRAVLSSVLNYGVSEFDNVLVAEKSVGALADKLAAILARYEPRLDKRTLNVRGKLVRDAVLGTGQREKKVAPAAIEFVIEAEVCGDEYPRRITISTQLDVKTKEYTPPKLVSATTG